MHHVLIYLAWLSLFVVARIGAQDTQERMIVGTRVMCRAEPRRDATVRRVYPLGELVGQIQQTGASERWYLTGSNCWIFGPLTVEFDRSKPEVAYVAAADRALNRADATFEELVEVENLLRLDLFHENLLQSSGLLQYKRLEILRRIASLNSVRIRQVLREPLKNAWFIAHQDVLRYYEPDGRYFVPVKAYWDLHDRSPNETWSDELAWTAAQIHIPSDECYSDCVFKKIDLTFAQYWSRHPRGIFVNDAVDRAIPMATYAISMSIYDEPPQILLGRLRRSLDAVSSTAKQRFLDLLNEAEQKYRPLR